MNILVVDDDPLAGEMIVATLESFDHQVSLATHALEALELLADSAHIDLMISDMNMPMVSGLELFDMLRDQGNAIPFILLTGDDPEPLLIQQPALDACVLKDFSLDETLPEMIAQVMARHTGGGVR
jgi:CheY-like chemotaxis protein